MQLPLQYSPLFLLLQLLILNYEPGCPEKVYSLYFSLQLSVDMWLNCDHWALSFKGNLLKMQWTLVLCHFSSPFSILNPGLWMQRLEFWQPSLTRKPRVIVQGCWGSKLKGIPSVSFNSATMPSLDEQFTMSVYVKEKSISILSIYFGYSLMGNQT